MRYKFRKEYKNEIFSNGLHQLDMANEVGVSPEHINQVVNGKYNCSKTLAILFTIVANKNLENKYDMHQLFEEIIK